MDEGLSLPKIPKPKKWLGKMKGASSRNGMLEKQDGKAAGPRREGEWIVRMDRMKQTHRKKDALWGHEKQSGKQDN